MATVFDPAVPRRRMPEQVPGLVLALLVAVAARVMSEVTSVPPVLLALVLGMALSGAGERIGARSGLDLGGRHLLRCGVALLGFQITMTDVAAVGWRAGLLTLGAMMVTLILGYALSRLIGLERGKAIIATGAVAICGASAALAIAAAMPPKDVDQDDVARTVGSVTIIGSAAMLAYPLLALWLGLDARHAGIFIGGALHDVAQAVAAGFSMSNESGETATLVKLLRVSCLGFVVFGVGAFLRGGAATGVRAPLLPAFLIAFLGFAVLSSLHVVPPAVTTIAAQMSRWMLLIAIASLGLKSSFAMLLKGSGRLIASIMMSTLILAAIMLTGAAMV